MEPVLGIKIRLSVDTDFELAHLPIQDAPQTGTNPGTGGNGSRSVRVGQ